MRGEKTNQSIVVLLTVTLIGIAACSLSESSGELDGVNRAGDQNSDLSNGPDSGLSNEPGSLTPDEELGDLDPVYIDPNLTFGQQTQAATTQTLVLGLQHAATPGAQEVCAVNISRDPKGFDPVCSSSVKADGSFRFFLEGAMAGDRLAVWGNGHRFQAADFNRYDTRITVQIWARPFPQGIRVMARDERRLYAGTVDGLYIMPLARLRNRPEVTVPIRLTAGDGLGNNAIVHLAVSPLEVERPLGEVWVLSKTALVRLTFTDGLTEKPRMERIAWRSAVGGATNLGVDKDGTVWLGSKSYLFRVVPELKEDGTVTYRIEVCADTLLEGLKNQGVQKALPQDCPRTGGEVRVYVDPSGENIWVASQSNFKPAPIPQGTELDPRAAGDFIRYLYLSRIRPNLPAADPDRIHPWSGFRDFAFTKDNISRLLVDDQNHAWVATQNRALLRLTLDSSDDPATLEDDRVKRLFGLGSSVKGGAIRGMASSFGDDHTGKMTM